MFQLKQKFSIQFEFNGEKIDFCPSGIYTFCTFINGLSIFFQGRTFQSQIEFSMARNTHLNKVLLEKYTSSKVRKIYENVLRNVEKTYPQYIDELRGIAAGSKISFFKVYITGYQSMCVYFRCSTFSYFCCILMKLSRVSVEKNLMVDF